MSGGLGAVDRAKLSLIADEDCAIQSKASLTNFFRPGEKNYFSFIYNQGQDECT